jgi:tellurite resistance protein TehA-like permease
MPKAVLEKYFKPPYFRELECMLFTGIPYAPIRTVMFMRVIGFPSSGKVRGISDAYLLVPNWYRIVSKVMIIVAVVNMVVVLLCMLGIGVLYLHHGPS